MKIYQSSATCGRWGNEDHYTFWISTEEGTSWFKATLPDRDHNLKPFPPDWCKSMEKKATPKVYDDQQNVLENE